MTDFVKPDDIKLGRRSTALERPSSKRQQKERGFCARIGCEIVISVVSLVLFVGIIVITVMLMNGKKEIAELTKINEPSVTECINDMLSKDPTYRTSEKLAIELQNSENLMKSQLAFIIKNDLVEDYSSNTYPTIPDKIAKKGMRRESFKLWKSLPTFTYNDPKYECYDCEYRKSWE